MMDEAAADPGECGIQADWELSMRFWWSGWQARGIPPTRGVGVGEPKGLPEAYPASTPPYQRVYPVARQGKAESPRSV